MRNMTAKSAANSISAPLIIWYTLAVTLSRPMFIRTVAIRSKKEGIASSRVSLRLPLAIPLCRTHVQHRGLGGVNMNRYLGVTPAQGLHGRLKRSICMLAQE